MKEQLLKQAMAELNTLKALSLAIAQLGEVPSGHLYAQLMGVMDLRMYEWAIGKLKSMGLVTERGNLLTWTGPKIDAPAAA
jgi:hypothetical protein